MTLSNLKLTDQLGQVREEIKLLQVKEKCIRQKILDAPYEVENGDFFALSIVGSKRTVLDRKALEALLGEQMSSVERTSTVTTVKTTPIVNKSLLPSASNNPNPKGASRQW